jgi:hypothetical protein
VKGHFSTVLKIQTVLRVLAFVSPKTKGEIGVTLKTRGYPGESRPFEPSTRHANGRLIAIIDRATCSYL